MRGWGVLILILLASFAIQHYLWNHQLLSSSTGFLGASSWICVGDTANLEVAIKKTNLLHLTEGCDLHNLAFQIIRIRVSDTLPTGSHTPFSQVSYLCAENNFCSMCSQSTEAWVTVLFVLWMFPVCWFLLSIRPSTLAHIFITTLTSIVWTNEKISSEYLLSMNRYIFLSLP